MSINIDSKYLEDVQEELTLYKAYRHAYEDAVKDIQKHKECMEHIFRLTSCDYTRDCILKALEGTKWHLYS